MYRFKLTNGTVSWLWFVLGGLVKKLLESKKEQETVQTKKTEIVRANQFIHG